MSSSVMTTKQFALVLRSLVFTSLVCEAQQSRQHIEAIRFFKSSSANS